MITVRKTRTTPTHSHWKIEHKGQLHTTITTRTRRTQRLTELRTAITHTLHIPASQLRFIGNVRLGDMWVSQWTTLDEIGA